jgi:hypothetical protein
MISYSKDQGRAHLEQFEFRPGDFELHPEQALKIGFSAIGLDKPCESDLALFNSKLKIFHIEYIKDGALPGATHFNLTIKSKRQKSEAGSFVDLAPLEATTYCIGQALNFLASLAISTNTIVVWRQLSAAPREVRTIGIAMPASIQFVDQYKVLQAQIPMHAGHLYMAINVFGHLHIRNWPERFYRLYHKGMMLFAAPEMPEMSFLEESYNCFYKCFEYLVMAKVLQKSGQYKASFLPSAFKKLGISPKDQTDVTTTIKGTGNYLSGQRGNVVAHYIMGQDTAQITPKDVFELKSLIDFMLRAFVALKL